MRKLSMAELQRKSVEDFKEAEKVPVVIVLDNIRSMHNVGSIFRTADGFLIKGIYLCGFTPCPPHRDINKTALGATETVDWSYFSTTMEAALRLKEQGFTLVAVEQVEESLSPERLEFPENGQLALIFGNEVDGVSEEVLSLCEAAIEIPQMGMKHSLNVSVAAGIVLWEMFKSYLIQRKKND